jgi:hypothetical protein
MRRRRNRALLARRGLALLGTGVAGGAVIVTVLAQSASGWDLSIRNTSGGGGRSALGTTVIEGSIGQPFTGTSAQGNFSVASGMYQGGPTKYIRRMPALASDGIPTN